MSKGIVYIAFGIPYLLMAAHSSRTLKKSNPDLKIQVITNFPISTIKVKDQLVFDNVTYISDATTGSNRNFKVSLNAYSLWDKSLYLDCDTEVHGSLEPLFDLLDFHPVALKFNSYYFSRDLEILDKPSDYYGLSDWNGGVIAFKKEDDYTNLFFESWYNNFRLLNKKADQYSLRKTIYELKRLPLPLSNLWNAKYDIKADKYFIDNHFDTIKILHYREPFLLNDVSKRFNETISLVDFSYRKECNEDDVLNMNKELENTIKKMREGSENYKLQIDMTNSPIPTKKDSTSIKRRFSSLANKIFSSLGYEIIKINKRR